MNESALEVHQHGGSILGSVNLGKIIRQIFEHGENVQILNLEKCLNYLSPLT